MHEHELIKNALAKGQVLICCTSSSTVGDRTDAGVWLSEVAIPYCKFKDAGYDVTICSVKGGDVPVDAACLAEQDKHPELVRFLADDAAMMQLRHSVPLASVEQPGAYCCVYLAGGQAAMADMPADPQLARVVGEAAQAGRLIATVCHGPAGLLGVNGPDGKPLVAGRTVACFTQQEEQHTGAAGSLPFQMEARLKELGAQVHPEQVNQENAVRDGQLITGQNHNSSAKVVSLVLEALSVHPSGPAEEATKAAAHPQVPSGVVPPSAAGAIFV